MAGGKRKKKGEMRCRKIKELEAQNQRDENANRPVPIQRYESPMFNRIQEANGSFDVIVADWVQDYLIDQSEAYLNLIQMIFNASGCTKQLLKFQVESNYSHSSCVVHYMAMQLRIQIMDENHTRHPDTVHPKVKPGTMGKKMCKVLRNLFVEIIQQTKNSLLYDGFMMPYLTNMLTCMACSTVRAFRFTGTFIGLKLITVLAAVLTEYQEKTVATNDDLQFARRIQNYDQRKELKEKLREDLEKGKKIKIFLEDLFYSCFTLRECDPMYQIRKLLVEELCIWLLSYTELFQHLSKYFRRPLADPVASVRQAGLEAVLRLSELQVSTRVLEPLLNLIKPLLLDLTRDKNLKVGILAIYVLTSIKTLHSQTVPLTLDEYEDLFGFMYSKQRAIAVAAARFFVVCHKDFHDHSIEEKTVKHISVTWLSESSEAETFIKNLVTFHFRKKLRDPRLFYLLIDSLFDQTPYLVNWRAMIDLALKVVNIDYQGAIVKLMATCVERAVTGMTSAKFVSPKKKPSKKPKQLAEEKARMTGHFMHALPELLLIHHGDSGNLKRVLSIMLHLDLSVFLFKGSKHVLIALLEAVRKIVMNSTDDAELKICVKVLTYFESLNKKYIVNFNSIMISDLKTMYQDAYDDWKNMEEDSFPEFYDLSLTLSLRRIVPFAKGFNRVDDLSSKQLDDILNDAVDENHTLLPKTHIYGLQLYYIWLLHSAQQDNTDSVIYKKFMKKIKVILNSGSATIPLKELAYRSACNLFFVLQLETEDTKYLSYWHTLADFLKNAVLFRNDLGFTVDQTRQLLLSFWKIILKGVAPSSFAYIYLANFNKMTVVCKECIEEMFSAVMKSDLEKGANLLMSGLKGLLLYEIKFDDKFGRVTDTFQNILQITCQTVGWLQANTTSSKANVLSNTLVNLFKDKLPWDMDESQMPFFEMMAQFSSELSGKHKAQLLEKVKSIFLEKHTSLRIFINAISAKTKPGLRHTAKRSRTVTFSADCV